MPCHAVGVCQSTALGLCRYSPWLCICLQAVSCSPPDGVALGGSGRSHLNHICSLSLGQSDLHALGACAYPLLAVPPPPSLEGQEDVTTGRIAVELYITVFCTRMSTLAHNFGCELRAQIGWNASLHAILTCACT